jgi:hypothetical protein
MQFLTTNLNGRNCRCTWVSVCVVPRLQEFALHLVLRRIRLVVVNTVKASGVTMNLLLLVCKSFSQPSLYSLGKRLLTVQRHDRVVGLRTRCHCRVEALPTPILQAPRIAVALRDELRHGIVPRELVDRDADLVSAACWPHLLVPSLFGPGLSSN